MNAQVRATNFCLDNRSSNETTRGHLQISLSILSELKQITFYVAPETIRKPMVF